MRPVLWPFAQLRLYLTVMQLRDLDLYARRARKGKPLCGRPCAPNLQVDFPLPFMLVIFDLPEGALDLIFTFAGTGDGRGLLRDVVSRKWLAQSSLATSALAEALVPPKPATRSQRAQWKAGGKVCARNYRVAPSTGRQHSHAPRASDGNSCMG